MMVAVIDSALGPVPMLRRPQEEALGSAAADREVRTQFKSKSFNLKIYCLLQTSPGRSDHDKGTGSREVMTQGWAHTTPSATSHLGDFPVFPSAFPGQASLPVAARVTPSSVLFQVVSGSPSHWETAGPCESILSLCVTYARLHKGRTGSVSFTTLC